MLSLMTIYLACLVIGGILVGASLFAGGQDHDHDLGGHDHDHELGGHDHEAAGDRDAGEADHELGAADGAQQLGGHDHELGGHDHDHELGGHDHELGGHDHGLGGHDHGVFGHGFDADGHALVGGGGEAVAMDHGPTGDAAAALQTAGPRGRSVWLPFFSLRFWTFSFAFFGLTGTVFTGLGLADWGATLLVALLVGGGSGTAMAYLVHTLREQQVGVVTGPADFLGREAIVSVRVGPGRLGKVRLNLQDGVTEILAEADEEIPQGEKVLVFEMSGPVARVARTPRDELAELEAAAELPPRSGG